jgi:hypothetical protein
MEPKKNNIPNDELRRLSAKALKDNKEILDALTLYDKRIAIAPSIEKTFTLITYPLVGSGTGRSAESVMSVHITLQDTYDTSNRIDVKAE